jgi:hypothetical protein
MKPIIFPSWNTIASYVGKTVVVLLDIIIVSTKYNKVKKTL